MSEGLRIAELDFDGLVEHEWLVANGVGGFASATASGTNTRRYHGLLVAAMTPPVRRMVLLSRLEETLVCEGREFYLAANEYPGAVWPRGHEHLRAFSTEPYPRWAYQGDGWTVEKQLRLVRGENTVLVSYTLLGGTACLELEVRPLLALRGIHELMYQWNGRLAAEARAGAAAGHWRVPATNRTPEVFFAHDGAFERKPNWYLNTVYRRERERGYPGLEDLWCPGVVRLRLVPGKPAYFACSADPFELPQVIARAGRQVEAPAPLPGVAAPPPVAPDADLAALSRAAEAHLLATRNGDSFGCGVRYPWGAPSPRPALAGLAGLYLIPGRFTAARALLQSLAARLDGGLLPSEFPEDGGEPVYHGADVSLWFVNAVHQYLAYTGDETAVRRHLLAPVFEIVDAYRRGTGLGIAADPDGLLASRAAGVGVTWMDAKLGDWVVTPRHGRAVEVNALWYNAVAAAADLAKRFDVADRAELLGELAASIRAAFDDRFWNDEANCCYDVIDEGVDTSVRPNQLLAVSLPFPVLAAPERQAAVVETVGAQLLTPFGVRTLAPSDPGYQGRAGGNAVERDRAYHNGSAFPWLLGPYVTALLRVRGRTDAARAEARRLLEPCIAYLRGRGMGQIAELFDGDAPHAPGGALASSLGIAEVLRCYAEDVLGRTPGGARNAGAVDNAARPASIPNVRNPA